MSSVARVATGTLLIACSLLRADWTVEKRVDSMTDREIRLAVSTNAEGFLLQFYRNTDNSVWATFRLPDTGSDVLGSDAPVYRVDKHPPTTIGPQSPLLPSSFEVKPKWLNWLVFHGDGPANRGTLRDIMEGTRVIFRYFLFTGGYKETSFSLVGAKAVIADALGVPAEVDSAAAAREEAFVQATSEMTDRCQKVSKDLSAFAECLKKHSDCLKVAKGDAVLFRECVK